MLQEGSTSGQELNPTRFLNAIVVRKVVLSMARHTELVSIWHCVLVVLIDADAVAVAVDDAFTV